MIHIHKQKRNYNENDIGTPLGIKYTGDMMMIIYLQVPLVLNYPGERFMTLPVNVTVNQLQVPCLCLLTHI